MHQYLVFAVGGIVAHLYLQLRVDVLRDGHGGAVDGLVGEHQTHVAIHAQVGLFHAVDIILKLGREIEYAVAHLFLDQVFCVFHVVAAIGHAGVGRGIELAYELARQLRVGHVDNGNGNLAHHLVVVDP